MSMIDSKIPWDQVILSVMRSGFEVELSEIYDSIRQVAKDGSYIVNSQLYDIEPRWGERYKYTHAVRAAMCILKKRGMVNRIARGCYQITEAGQSRLKELQELY